MNHREQTRIVYSLLTRMVVYFSSRKVTFVKYNSVIHFAICSQQHTHLCTSHTSHIPLTYVHVNTEHTCYNTNTCTGDRPQRLYNVCVDRMRCLPTDSVYVYMRSAPCVFTFSRNAPTASTRRGSATVGRSSMPLVLCCTAAATGTLNISSLCRLVFCVHTSRMCVCYIFINFCVYHSRIVVLSTSKHNNNRIYHTISCLDRRDEFYMIATKLNTCIPRKCK